MSTAYILVSASELPNLELTLGKGHDLCDRVRIAFKDFDDPNLAKYRAAALQQSSSGELEIDSNALVSKGDDDGAYVMGWLWISDDEAETETGGVP